MGNVRLGDLVRTADGSYFEAAVQDGPAGTVTVRRSFGACFTVPAAGAVIVKDRLVTFLPRPSHLRDMGVTAAEYVEAYKTRALTDPEFCLNGGMNVGTYRAGVQAPERVATWVLGSYERQAAVLAHTEVPVEA